MEHKDYPLDNMETAERALCDLGLETIINRRYLQRLKDIRLLGTMQYVVPLKHNYSRYEHSLAVAYLTLSAVQSLGLSNVAIRVAVLAALLHDVGHTAMSHAAEVFLLQRHRKFHEDHTCRIVTLLSKELSSVGEKNLATLVQLANDLLSGHLSSSSYRRLPDGKCIIDDDDIFILDELTTGAMSIDMIEGVTRTARSIGLAHPDASMLVSSLSRTKQELMVSAEAWPAVWALFELQRKIYNDYIYSTSGMAAEAMLTRALELVFPQRNQSLEEREVQDFDYDLANDFLTMTDKHMSLCIQEHPVAKDLLQRLESRNLFVSLASISPKVLKDIIDYVGEGYDIVFEDSKRAVEKSLASHLNLEPSQVIFHSTIRKIFRFKGSEALRLFSDESTFSEVMTRSYSEIRRQFKTERTSRTLLDVFFSEIEAEDSRNYSLPSPVSLGPPKTYPAISKRFRRGGEEKNGTVATPQKVIDFLVAWALRSSSDTMLDPACGDAAFLQEGWNRLVSLGASREGLNQIRGVERHPGLWQETRRVWQERIIQQDFFDIRPGEHGLHPVDAVVGNPPYVRAHRFKGKDREKALQAANETLNQFLRNDMRLRQGSSSWAPFLIHACAFLRPSGRLAMVLPTELLTADYAKPIRELLKKRFHSLSFVLFKKRIFEQEQDTLLLLADSVGKPGINRTEIDGPERLDEVMALMTPAPHSSDVWIAGKWTTLLTSQHILDLLHSLFARNVAIQFGTIATIRIGLVTGNSEFFTLKPSEAKSANLKNEWLTPILTKANQIPGAVFTREDLDKLRQTDAKHLVLRIPPDTDLSLDPDLQSYIEKGRSQGIHSLQKCRTRWPWYSVPYSEVPDVFLTYMSGKRCRLCLNEAQVNCTNNLHQVFLKHQALASMFIVSFYSSLTGLSIELAGRGYGGGLIKLEPGDAKLLLLPNLERLAGTTLARIPGFLPQIDTKLRTQPDDGVWEDLDELILVQGLGLSIDECRMIQQEYIRLRDRRMNRAQRNETVVDGRMGDG